MILDCKLHKWHLFYFATLLHFNIFVHNEAKVELGCSWNHHCCCLCDSLCSIAIIFNKSAINGRKHYS